MKNTSELLLKIMRILAWFVFVALLIKAGANPNLKDRFGSTSLFEAVKSGHDEVAQFIFDSKGEWLRI